MFSKTFRKNEQPWWLNEEDGVDSRVLASGAGITVIEWTFKHKGHIVPLHAHYHEQVSYITQGSAECTLADGSTSICKAGEAVYFGPNEEHKVVTLEDNTIIVDAFTPCRLDHLAKHTTYVND